MIFFSTFHRKPLQQFYKVINKARNLTRRVDTLMLTRIIPTPIHFLTKDRSYYGSLYLVVIDLLVIQCQRCLPTDALNLLEALREKNLYSELFWSSFSGIWTEYGERRSLLLSLKSKRTEFGKFLETIHRKELF